MTIHRKLLMVLMCIVVLTSCGLYNDAADTADTANTIDDAATLLQDLEDRNVWETVSDRLITLSDQMGYSATITLQRGAIDEVGGWIAPLETDMLLVVEVDEANNARINLTDGDQTRRYIVLGYETGAEHPLVYRVEDGGYVCVTEGNHSDYDLIRGGVYSVFDAYGIDVIGMQTLAVVDRTDNEDALVAGRKAIEYDLISKVEDAAKIVAELDNGDLQAALNTAGQFELSGDLYLDDETLALLRVTSLYTDLSSQQRYTLGFEVIQWGGIADIMPPAETDIIEKCQE